MRPSREYRVCIRLLENGSTILNLPSRNDFQPFCFRDCVFAAVWFKVADHDVHAQSLQMLGFFEHLEGLADTSSVAHEDFQFAALLFRHLIEEKPARPCPVTGESVDQQ